MSYFDNQKSIRVYHTHIEVSPYKKGEVFSIEKNFSTWNNIAHRYDSGVYVIGDDTLYLPRGMNVMNLETIFNTKATMIYDHDPYKTFSDVKMIVEPRDDLQRDCIDFLTARGKYAGVAGYSQQALVLQTGFGKTYCMVNAIVSMRVKALIVTTQDKIKYQWIKTFKEKTTIPEDRLIDIKGSNIMEAIVNGEHDEGYVYFINHQTLLSFLKTYGPDEFHEFFRSLHIGVKVYDEAHLCFRNALFTDYFSDTVRTYYLTANFTRSNDKEAYLYNKCFASVYKYRVKSELAETSSAASRKHILYYPTTFRSNPPASWQKKCDTYKGFSGMIFADWAFKYDPNETLLHAILDRFEEAKKHKGKILITVPKIDNIEIVYDALKKDPSILDGRTIGTIHSKNKKEDNESAKKDVDVIVSTIRSCGTGVDINGLRSIINAEPFSSQITANQLSGRLREFSPTDDTYFYDLIDIGFEPCKTQLTRKLGILRSKCKAVYPENFVL